MKVLICLFLCLGLDTIVCNATVYYVTSHSSKSDCPTTTEPCHTIGDYAGNNFFDKNESILLVFLSGTHNLASLNLIIVQRESVTLYPETNATIQIQNEAQLVLENIQIVNMTGLKFVSANKEHISPGCMDDVEKNIRLLQVDVVLYEKLVFEQCSIAIESVRNMTIDQINFSISWIYYSLGSNSTHQESEISFRKSDFSLSTIAILHTLCENESEPFEFVDHNVRFEIENCSLSDSFFTVQVESESSVNIDLSFKDTMVTSANGTSNNPTNKHNVTGLYIDVSSNVTLHLEMNECELTSNVVGLAIAANGPSYVDVNIERCKFVGNGGNFPLIFSQRFGGIGLVFGKNTTANINISFTQISENKFVQVYIDDIVTMEDIISNNSKTVEHNIIMVDSTNSGITFELINSLISHAKDLDGFTIGLGVNAVSAHVNIQKCEFENSPVEIGTSEVTLVDNNFTRMGLFIRNPNASVHIDKNALLLTTMMQPL